MRLAFWGLSALLSNASLAADRSAEAEDYINVMCSDSTRNPYQGTCEQPQSMFTGEYHLCIFWRVSGSAECRILPPKWLRWSHSLESSSGVRMASGHCWNGAR